MSTNCKYCCEYMEYNISLQDDIISYYPTTRRYSIRINCGEEQGFHRPIWYCPWCGNKLPEDLEDKWSEILSKEYGIDSPGFTSKVPTEFDSDEWWKKRGL